MSDRPNFDTAPHTPLVAADPPGDDGTGSPADEQDWLPSAGPSPEDLLASLALAYRPTWNLRHNAVTTYACVPTLAVDGKCLVDSEIPGLSGDEVLYGLDLKILQRAADDLRSLLAADQRSLMLIPVHFQTLGTVTRRADYLARCRAAIPADSAKYLAFEILGVPEGIVTARLHEVTTALRRISRALLMRLSNSRAALPSARESGLAAIGYYCRSSAGTEAREIQDMERFAALAQRAGVSSFLCGVRSLSLASAAIATGVGFINGDAIAPLIDSPRSVYNFDAAGLYAQRLGFLSS